MGNVPGSFSSLSCILDVQNFPIDADDKPRLLFISLYRQARTIFHKLVVLNFGLAVQTNVSSVEPFFSAIRKLSLSFKTNALVV